MNIDLTIQELQASLAFFVNTPPQGMNAKPMIDYIVQKIEQARDEKLNLIGI